MYKRATEFASDQTDQTGVRITTLIGLRHCTKTRGNFNATIYRELVTMTKATSKSSLTIEIVVGYGHRKV